jgi:hypothetical protein
MMTGRMSTRLSMAGLAAVLYGCASDPLPVSEDATASPGTSPAAAVVAAVPAEAPPPALPAVETAAAPSPAPIPPASRGRVTTAVVPVPAGEDGGAAAETLHAILALLPGGMRGKGGGLDVTDALESLARRPRTGVESIVVFNPLAWPRSEPSRVAIPAPDPDFPPWGRWRSGRHAIDWQRDGSHYVFVAPDVPALGLRAIEMDPAPEAPPGTWAAFGDGSIENRWFRVTLDPASGGISGLYDKELEQEVVAPTAAGGIRVEAASSTPPGGRPAPDIRRRADGPVFASLVSRIPGEGEMEVTLWREVRRVDVVLRPAAGGGGRQAVFPFNFDNPEIRLEVSEGAEAAEEGTWRTVRSWVGVTASDGSWGVTLATPDARRISMGDPARGPTFGGPVDGHLAVPLPPARVPASARVAAVRFSIATHRGGATDAARARAAWGIAAPLMGVEVPANPGGDLEPLSGFADVSPADAILLGLRAAGEGRGWTARVWRAGAAEGEAALSFPHFEFRKATLLDAQGAPAQPLEIRGGAVRVPAGRDAVTVRLE